MFVAFLDGVTSVQSHSVEGDPLMVFLYQTDKPSTERIFVTGFIAIGIELAIAWVVNRRSHRWGTIVGILFAGQILIHTYCLHLNTWRYFHSK